VRRVLPLALLVLLGAGALAFDLTLPLRLPSDQDWAEAAGALRVGADSAAPAVVQIWPPWAERARLFVDAAPVVAEEDLAAADYLGARRLWLLALPRAPFGGLAAARAALVRRGAVSLGEARGFGALSLEEWDLRAPPVVNVLTSTREAHEVDYVARDCERVPIGARFERRGAGAVLHLRAGIIGERAYDEGRAPVEVRAAGLGTLTVRGAGWQRLDVPVPDGGERSFAFEIASADGSPPFCLQAWTTR
jgi:hypothetical protein